MATHQIGDFASNYAILCKKVKGAAQLTGTIMDVVAYNDYGLRSTPYLINGASVTLAHEINVVKMATSLTSLP